MKIDSRECPVIIRGVTYRSQKEAARSIGVHPGTVKNALDRGTLDYCGFGRNYHTKKKVYVNGVEYESQYAAARAIGWTETRFSSMVDRRRKAGKLKFKVEDNTVEISK